MRRVLGDDAQPNGAKPALKERNLANETLTEQQKNWMAKVAASLETSTGKTLAQWVEIAKLNPETKPRARVTWMKQHHGLGQNYAMQVLHAEAASRGRDAAGHGQLSRDAVGKARRPGRSWKRSKHR